MAHRNPDQQKIKHILDTSKRIAVVGLSDNPSRTSYQISSQMQQAGYEIIPVNPVVDEVLGVKAVKRLQDIDGPVDIVNVFRRSEFLPEVARDVLDIEAGTFWAQLGVSHDEVPAILKEKNINIVMDSCIKVEYQMTR
ncbi:putative CoA-binding protein [Sinobaca qinghaiensis]|uniref:Putative CoA-binding protein n=1 Tax=Sinobaca qinghaiensis TaxID=342944 RepID=A0A419UWI4_9BACL|nr:CoA-binding protein [Sinobaca qinghaiensis]RKD69484.1 putative CoA-binding protein [Sinobaca qinghaiensis]